MRSTFAGGVANRSDCGLGNLDADGVVNLCSLAEFVSSFGGTSFAAAAAVAAAVAVSIDEMDILSSVTVEVGIGSGGGGGGTGGLVDVLARVGVQAEGKDGKGGAVRRTGGELLTGTCFRGLSLGLSGSEATFTDSESDRAGTSSSIKTSAPTWGIRLSMRCLSELIGRSGVVILSEPKGLSEKDRCFDHDLSAVYGRDDVNGLSAVKGLS